MNHDYPKCLLKLFRKRIIEYILETVESIQQIDKTITVIGYKKELFEELLDNRVSFAYQEHFYGTGAATIATSSLIKEAGFTLIIPADKPLLTKKILEHIINQHLSNQNDLTIATTYDETNNYYGKIFYDENHNIKEIVENTPETFIKYQSIKSLDLNTSVYCLNNKYYEKLMQILTKQSNLESEIPLTDIVNIAYQEKLKIGRVAFSDYQLFYGINDFLDLAKIENYLRMNVNIKHMKNGIYLVNPDTITIGQEVEIESGTIIHPNTYITGNTIIKEKAIIGPNTEIHNSQIGTNSIVKHSLVYDSIIGNDCLVGPFAHLRMNNLIDNNIRIGNFVEIKNSTIGANSKASHHSYIGDATIGHKVNVGCGAITVNYDGKNKYKTIVGNNVFIGCNTNLIAPLEVSDNVVIGAGSTITNNIPKDSLSIARSYQINKEGYAKKYLKN